ncbi:3-deoxy-D-manno-octulosonic acid transferase [Nonlabens sp. MB-3u-79]|uniref:3-deoxy-D-manno-octulosonic acid transferase n=1 Tax=Nonlabens sp. MB-3u-79 TaxID=2058134 RepID=UPI000C31AD5F|nr:glycosyltransferase N-terminal domain-containing protein [Nonlabens sp. MB-3u-79]AUC78861.1 3-deoxy-D-manno-octulosonic acid transferase [Nonlabens sp. MB-3u-79]
MKTLYDIFSAFAKACLPLAGAFNKKLKLGAQGRERTWDILDKKVKSSLPKIWVHAASLGEFEQVVPVLERINRENYQVILTFFSPSGYENKKNTPLADVVCYLPLDAVSNVNKFIATVEPSLAIMVKYEFWPNYLNALQETNCKTILVSGVFRDKMSFNSWYGKWMIHSLESFDHFFLQNESSLQNLKKLGFTNASVSGDTRFDRASQLIERDSSITELKSFIGNKKCLVIGSSWPEDIAIMKNWLNNNDQNKNYKIIIAPHEVAPSSINQLCDSLNYHPIKWSSLQGCVIHDLESASTLIIDSIGLLTKVYSYADLAYVGGAMGTKGLHNILEAATYGVPVIIGKNYEKFPEAGKLEDLGGLFSVKDALEFESMTNQLLEDDYLRDKTGMICGHWINSNTGATREIVNYLKTIDEKLILD